MARHIKIAAAQLGPLHKSDSRAAAVSRLKKLLQDAHAMGAKFVVFPELALTTFFPRWWMDDQARSMRATSRRACRRRTRSRCSTKRRSSASASTSATPSSRPRGGASTPRSWSARRLDRRQVPQDPPAGHADHKPKAAFQHLEKKYFEVGDLGFRVWKYLGAITGMLICNDRRWPEAFRVLALQGAEIVALGFNTPSENLHYPSRRRCACITT